jgi:hypothetical protein
VTIGGPYEKSKSILNVMIGKIMYEGSRGKYCLVLCHLDEIYF